MSDWGTSGSNGWGESSSAGWGDSSSTDKGKSSSSGGGGGGGGWGDSSSNNKGESSSGGWGDSSSNNRGNSGSSSWGDNSSSNNRGRGGGGRPYRGRGGGGRDGGGGGGGGGGWGDSSSNNRGKSESSGGWGDSSSSNNRGKSESSGGWGDSSSSNNKGKSESSGGWGDSSSSNNKGKSESSGGDGGGWGGSASSGWGESSGGGGGGGGGGWNSDKGQDQGDQPNKRFKSDDDSFRKPREDGENGEERPAPYKPEDLDLDEEVKLQGSGAGENFKRYDEQTVICLPPGSVTPIEKFEDVITSELLVKNIRAQNYAGMTPIQKWSMPAILSKQDLIGCAQTGSGKTAAFLLPVLQDLLSSEPEPIDRDSDCQNPYCLIVSPTRELARQISVHAGMLSRDSIIKCHVIYGQIATAHLKSKLSTGCHILVATPGRLKDFVERGWIGFRNIRYVILDEGDRLVDDGFGAEIKNFFEHPTMPPKENRQTLFFSATFQDDTQMRAKEFLKNEFIFLTVGRIGAANQDIKQEFLSVSRQEKKRELKKILAEVPETEKTIVFTQTKMAADMLAGFFTALNLSSTSIHGDRHQSQREQAISSFKRGEKRFLISSPVGNRGLDLPKVSLVINYDLPNNIDEYVHRIGRTGRAGHTGRAISFYDEERDREILPQLIEILKEVKQDIPDWMEPGGSFGTDATASGGLGDSWDTAPASANQTSAPATDDWDGNQASSDDKNAQASSDNWSTPKKETVEENVETTTTATDSW